MSTIIQQIGIQKLECMSIKIPDDVIDHILKKHKDLTVILNIKSEDQLKTVIKDVIESPDEIHMNAYGVHYFLKKINNKWINVIVVDDIVKTAYIIGMKTYNRLRRRWQ